MSSETNITDNEKKNLFNCLQNIRDLLPTKKQLTSIEKYHILLDINNKINQSIKPANLDALQSEEVFTIYRDILLEKEKGLDIEALNFFEFFLRINPQLSTLYKKLKVHFIISRTIEKDYITNPESKPIIKYIKFLKSWIKLSPTNFPRLCGFSLIALATFERKMTNVKKFSIELLRLLAIHNTELFSWIGGFGVMANAVVNKEIDEIDDLSAKIADTIIYLLDEEKSRNIMMRHFDFAKIFAVFTDIKTNMVRSANDIEAHEGARLACQFILRMLRSPPGLLFLIQNKRYMESLVEAFRQPTPLQGVLFELFEELLNLQAQQIAYMLILQLYLLIECNFYNALLELAMVEKFEEKSKDLMKMFLKLCYNIYPQSHIPSNEFLTYAMKKNIDNAEAYDNKTLVSKIKSIMDNNSKIMFTQQLMKYFEMNPNSEEIRKNSFLYTCETLYLNLPSCYKDTRIVRKDVWMNLQVEPEPSMGDCFYLLKNLSEDPTKWPLQKLKLLFEKLGDIKKHAGEYIKEPLFKQILFFFQPRDNNFIYLPWKPQNFIHIEIAYKFFTIMLSVKEGVQLLESRISEGTFMIYESFMNTLQKLLTEHKQFLKGSMLKLDVSTYNDMNKSAITESKGRKQFYSFVESNPLIHKPKSLEFDNINVTLFREYFALIGYFTFFKKGSDLLKKYEILDKFAKLAKHSRFDHIISIFIISCNYTKDKIVRDFFLQVFNVGSEYLVRICLNVCSFLINSEYYNLIFIWMIDPIIDKLNTKARKEVKWLIIDILTELVLYTKYDLQILKKLNIELLKNNKKLLYALLRKENCIPLLEDSGLVKLAYENFKNDEEPVKAFEQIEKKLLVSTSHIREIDENYYFLYKHSHLNIDFCYSDSGSYLAALLRYPWGLRARIEQASKEYNISLNSLVCYNKEKNAIEIIGTMNNLSSLEILNEGFKFDKNEIWSFGVSLFVGSFLVNQLLEVVEVDYFTKIDYYCLQNLKQLDKDRYKIVKNGVEYYFKKTANNRYTVNKVVLYIYLENIDKKSSAKEKSSEADNFFDVICKTKEGAEYLRKNFIIHEITDKLNEITDTEEIKINILNIGNIAQNEEGAKILQDNKNLLKLLLVDYFKQKQSLSLKGVSLHVAHMFAKSATGRKLLSHHDWDVYFIYKKRISDPDDQYIAFPQLNKNENKAHVEKTEPKKQWVVFHNIVTHVHGQFKDSKSIQKQFIDFIVEISKNKSGDMKKDSKERIAYFKDNISEDIDLFMYIIVQLSFYIFSKNYRRNLWMILDVFFYTNNFLMLLDEADSIYNDFILNI